MAVELHSAFLKTKAKELRSRWEGRALLGLHYSLRPSSGHGLVAASSSVSRLRAVFEQRCNRSARRGLPSYRTFFTAIDCLVSYGELSGQGNLEFTVAKVALGDPTANDVCPSFSPGCFGGLVSVYSVLTRV